MFALHPQIRLRVDQHLLRLQHILIGALRLLERGGLEAVEMVVTLLSLTGEDDRSTLPVYRGVGLCQCTDSFVHHMAVQIAEDLTSPDEGPGKDIDSSDAAIRDGSEVGGVLLIHLNLAGDGKSARYLLPHPRFNLNTNPPLIFRPHLPPSLVSCTHLSP